MKGNGLLIGLVSKAKGKGKSDDSEAPESGESGETDEEKKDAAADVLAAVKGGDTDSLSMALERFFTACKME